MCKRTFTVSLNDSRPEMKLIRALAYRSSYQSVKSYAVVTTPKLLFHVHFPHPALSPVLGGGTVNLDEDQAKNEVAYRQLLVQSMLAVLLPTEDLQNPCLWVLIGDVLSDTILGKSVGGKACDGWLIWDGVTKVVQMTVNPEPPTVPTDQARHDNRSRLEKSGLLDTKQASHKEEARIKNEASSITTKVFWQVVLYGYYLYLAFLAIRSVALGLLSAASSSPKREQAGGCTIHPHDHGTEVSSNPPTSGSRSFTAARPILSYASFEVIGQLLSLNQRMPWVSGLLSLAKHHLMSVKLRIMDSSEGVVDK